MTAKPTTSPVQSAAKKRTDYSRSPRTQWVPYPALIRDRDALDRLGLIAGTRSDETPPKVVMTGRDWGRLVKDAKAAAQAILFLGDSWDTNPLIPRPKGVKLPRTVRASGPRTRRPSPFEHLKRLPADEAIRVAHAEHQRRVASGQDEEESAKTLLRALGAVKRAADNPPIKPSPLPEPIGSADDPENPVPIRDHFVVESKADHSLWTATRRVTDDAFTLQAHGGTEQRIVRPRELNRLYQRVGEAVAGGH